MTRKWRVGMGIMGMLFLVSAVGLGFCARQVYQEWKLLDQQWAQANDLSSGRRGYVRTFLKPIGPNEVEIVVVTVFPLQRARKLRDGLVVASGGSAIAAVVLLVTAALAKPGCSSRDGAS